MLGIITGSSGFVGQNLIHSLENDYLIVPLRCRYIKGQKIEVTEDIIIHLSGKVHDLKNTSNTQEYQEANFELTKQIFDSFLKSKNSKTFIFISSVKAIADGVEGILYEETKPCPKTDYGISKLNAERYILSKLLPKGKRVFILRPCMIHGPNNKGNLNIIYNLMQKKIPWPLGKYQNKRSFLSIDNFNFFVHEIIKNSSMKSNIFNLSDDEQLSTNSIIVLISKTLNIKILILNIPKSIIYILAIIGDYIKLPINSERLKKLTENYVVSNHKIKKAINKKLPLTASEGLIKTFNSFKKDNY